MPAETLHAPCRYPTGTQGAPAPPRPTQAAQRPSATVCLPYPPSTNRIWRSFRGNTVMSAEARRWKIQSALTARASGLRCLDGPVAVAITLHPKLTAKGRASRTRMDLDNCIKATLDALNGIAWTDDKRVARIVAEVGPPVPDGGLTVSVSPYTGF